MEAYNENFDRVINRADWTIFNPMSYLYIRDMRYTVEDKTMGKQIVVQNKRYGKWTVIRIIDDIDDKRMVLCRCDCGIEKPVQLDNLLNGGSTQCRKCSTKRIEVNSGDRHSNLTVLGEGKTVGYRRHIICICDCGEITSVRLSNLTSGNTKHCKRCGHVERNKKYRENKGLDPEILISPKNKMQRDLFQKSLRVKILIRDGGKCQLCFNRAETVHHIIPWSDCHRPEDEHLKFDPENCISLCKDCHFHKAHGGNNHKIDSVVADQLLSIAIKNTESHPELMAGMLEEVQQNLERIADSYDGHQ